MFGHRHQAPWLPALIAGGLGVALISRRARWHAAQHGFGPGPGGQRNAGHKFGGPGFGGRWTERGLPPRIEEMLNAWHRQAHEGGTPGPAPETPGGAEPGKSQI